ncbi:MAG: hydrolase [Planctomycetes bacterium]|nr:hydrolase [Planctomycetota bacterium]
MSARSPCRCCGFLTLGARGNYEICPVCFWEDDVLENPEIAGGANAVSLREAQASYRRIGACEARFLDHVRAPLPEEQPPRLRS